MIGFSAATRFSTLSQIPSKQAPEWNDQRIFGPTNVHAFVLQCLLRSINSYAPIAPVENAGRLGSLSHGAFRPSPPAAPAAPPLRRGLAESGPDSAAFCRLSKAGSIRGGGVAAPACHGPWPRERPAPAARRIITSDNSPVRRRLGSHQTRGLPGLPAAASDSEAAAEAAASAARARTRARQKKNSAAAAADRTPHARKRAAPGDPAPVPADGCPVPADSDPSRARRVFRTGARLQGRGAVSRTRKVVVALWDSQLHSAVLLRAAAPPSGARRFGVVASAQPRVSAQHFSSRFRLGQHGKLEVFASALGVARGRALDAQSVGIAAGLGDRDGPGQRPVTGPRPGCPSGQGPVTVLPPDSGSGLPAATVAGELRCSVGLSI